MFNIYLCFFSFEYLFIYLFGVQMLGVFYCTSFYIANHLNVVHNHLQRVCLCQRDGSVGKGPFLAT